MYKSKIKDENDQSLEFEFDPTRPFHKNNSTINWIEFPYKQKVIEKLISQVQDLTYFQAAGALLISRGKIGGAKGQLELCTSKKQWQLFEQRFLDERAAFKEAKKIYILDQVYKSRSYLNEMQEKIETSNKLHEIEEKNNKQLILRFENGEKYEGEVFDNHGDLIPHGEGILLIPEKYGKSANLLSTPKLKKYSGQWMKGNMHGKGEYWWRNGDSWEGTFSLNELHGKGIFKCTKEKGKLETRIRYFNYSRHVCWGDELTAGTRIKIFPSIAENKNILAIIKERQGQSDGDSKSACILDFNSDNGQHYVKFDEYSERWIDLSCQIFEKVSSRPIAAYISQRENL